MSISRGVMPNVPVHEGKGQQLDIAHSVSDRPLEHLSDETLRFLLLVENARQLEGGSGVAVDGEAKEVTG